MGKYSHVTCGTAPNQLDNSFSALVWGLLSESFWVLFQLLLPLHLAHISTIVWKAWGSFRSEILGENKQGRQTDGHCVGLVCTSSTLGSIRKSLVPLNHWFLHQTLSVLWVMDFYNLCQCLAVEFPDAFREAFFPERCCHDHGENPSPLSVFNQAAVPVVLSTF